MALTPHPMLYTAAGIGFGFLASDPTNQQVIMGIGFCHTRDIEDSNIGVWARFCPEQNAWYHTAWKNMDEKQYCITYKLPDSYKEPYTCVGEGSHFEKFRGPSTMAEDDEGMLRFASYSARAQGGMEVYVNSGEYRVPPRPSC
jgi:hypothetical protein